MAHDIATTNSAPAMAYTGETPWHGLGASLTRGANLDTWIQESGLTYNVKSSPLGFYPNAVRNESGEVTDLGAVRALKSRVALFRDDTHQELSIVSNGYKVVQPKQVMEFFRDLSNDNKLQMETAGALKGGAVYWALARMEDSFTVDKKDEVLPYVLLATSCDGSLATTAAFTSIRVVCQNTLSWAVGTTRAATGKVKIMHNSVFDEEQVKRDLGLIEGSWEDFKVKSKQLAKRRISQEELVRFMVGVFTEETKGSKILESEDVEAQLRALPAVARALDVYHTGVGQGMKSTKDTAFGLVNAITRYTDFEVKALSNESRLRSAWFGAGARRKQKAVKLAMELV